MSFSRAIKYPYLAINIITNLGKQKSFAETVLLENYMYPPLPVP